MIVGNVWDDPRLGYSFQIRFRIVERVYGATQPSVRTPAFHNIDRYAGDSVYRSILELGEPPHTHLNEFLSECEC